MVKVKMYTKSYCPYCRAALKFFEELKIDVENIEVDEKPDVEKNIKEETGHHTFPQIFINDDFIGGFDDLIEFNESGKLEKLLN